MRLRVVPEDCSFGGALTGDDRICTEAREAFPGVRTVETKKSIGWSATDSLQPATACAAIEDVVAQTTAGASDLLVRRVPERLDLAVDFASALGADLAAVTPGTQRIDAHTLWYRPRVSTNCSARSWPGTTSPPWQRSKPPRSRCGHDRCTRSGRAEEPQSRPTLERQFRVPHSGAVSWRKCALAHAKSSCVCRCGWVCSEL
ncbi:M55 family metallopeptidase [Nocardia sp. NPDC051052]|uniref:M55 family metallopeptidase n=1 Tax=Nocardia sp. NPDC051052 TaxID=3364322 RepID=UPI00379C67DD